MRLIPALVAVLFALLITGVLLWKKEGIRRLTAVNNLFAKAKIVHNFSNMDKLFYTVPIPVTSQPKPLPEGSPMKMPADWEDWLQRRVLTAAVVLRNGMRVHESYHQGTQQSDQRISWSVAKSYLSALFGIIRAKGLVGHLDSAVTDYLPELTGSAYDGASLRNVLQMSSGVKFNEDYLNFWSDINKMGRVLALGGSMDRFTTLLKDKIAEPGTQWNYVSTDTHVLAMVLRRVTGRRLPDLLSEYLLTPMGVYGMPKYVTDKYGVAWALGGLTLTTRDYARMGELYRNNGVANGVQIVPADWVTESTTPSAPTEPGELQYGYQWWMPADAAEGEFMALGIYGQFIYVDRQSGTVIAINAADRNFKADGMLEDAVDMMRRIARDT